MATREMTIEFKGRAAASVKQASEQARRAVGGVGDETEKSAKKAQGGLSRIGAGLAGFAGGIVGNAVAAGAQKVKDFVGQSITAASDMTETLSKSRAIFGPLAGDMERWASGAPKAFGLAKAEALSYSAGLGDMARQIGFTSQEAASFGKDLVGVSADLGSFSNLETGDVLERISAALRGEYDSLQAVIPNINAARVEQEALAATGKKAAKELTAQEKALAIQAILHKDGARAMGDFAKTSGGFANQQKIAAAQVADLQAKLGTALLPILTTVMAFITNTAVPALTEFATGAGSNIAPALADFGSTLSGLLPFVGQLAAFIAQNIKVLAPLTAGLVLLNVVLSANPIGLVVLALGALVAGLMYAYQNSETFRRIVDATFRAVQITVTAVVGAVTGALSAVVTWTQNVIRAFIETHRRVVAAITGLARGVINGVQTMRDRAIAFVTQLRDRFIGANVALRDGAVRAVTQTRDRAVAFVQSLRDRAVGFVVNLRDRVIGGARAMRDGTVSAVLGLRDRAVAYVVSLRDRAIAFVLSLRDRTIAAFRAARDRAVDAFFQMRQWVVDRLVGLRDTAARVAAGVRDRVLSPFRLLRDGAVKIFSGLRDTVGRVFAGLLDRVKGPLRTVFGWLNDKLIRPLNSVTSKFGLTIPSLPKFHRGGEIPGFGEMPIMALGKEGVLNRRAMRQIGGRRGLDVLNAGGPGEWIKQFGEFISTPAKLVAQMAQQGVKWAVSQVLGAIPNIPTSGVPVADLVPSVLNQLKSKITSWAAGKEAQQQAELGAAASGSIGSGPWVRPIAAGIGNGYLGYPGHYGVDMPAAIGTAVHSVSNGIVSKAMTLAGSYGNHMSIRHADGLVTLYAHLSSRLASVGQAVKAGQVIARSGNSGNSTGPHLHFETRPGGGYPGPNPRSVMRARGVTLDSGGMLQPGLTLAYNGTGGPEPVLTGSQWSEIASAKNQPTIVVNLYGLIDKHAAAREIVDVLETYDTSRRGVQIIRRTR